MQLMDRVGQRMERARTTCRWRETASRGRRALRPGAHVGRIGARPRDEPAQRAAPFDQLLAAQVAGTAPSTSPTSRHSGAAAPRPPRRNDGCVWSRTLAQNVRRRRRSAVAADLRRDRRSTAGAAPDSRTDELARVMAAGRRDAAAACPPHSLRPPDRLIGRALEHARRLDSSAAGRHFSDTSVSTPSVPSAPVISRATSKPATFFITRPPNDAGRRRCRRQCARRARGRARRPRTDGAVPTSPVATQTAERGARAETRRARNPSICPRAASVAHRYRRARVPARAVTTSSGRVVVDDAGEATSCRARRRRSR